MRDQANAQVEFLKTPNRAAIATIILAHGAMAPMDSPFLDIMTELLVIRGLSVVRFEFAYMAERRRPGGLKKPPPRAEKLLCEYNAAVAHLHSTTDVTRPLIIGGKSLGGRVASMVASGLFAQNAADGLVCLGYPFHPLKKPENLRISHFEIMPCPTLILQGERDPFGTKAEIATYRLDEKIQFQWIGDGDHDFSPRVRSGYTKTQNMNAAADTISAFAQSLVSTS